MIVTVTEIFDHIDELRKSGGRVAVATLVNTRGTTPRKEGAKMVVGEGGAILGSVTIGGCVDAQVIEQAEDVLTTMRPRLLEMNLGDEEAWEIGLTCGGTIEVFVEPLALNRPDDVGSGFYDRVHARARAGGRGAIVTRLDDGGGHVAMPLTTLARTLGYRTAVVDGRPRFATRERFPEVDDLKVGIPSELIRDYPLIPSTALVLVAHDYKYDLPVLRHALATEGGYVGMQVSDLRGDTILKCLSYVG